MEDFKQTDLNQDQLSPNFDNSAKDYYNEQREEESPLVAQPKKNRLAFLKKLSAVKKLFSKPASLIRHKKVDHNFGSVEKVQKFNFHKKPLIAVVLVLIVAAGLMTLVFAHSTKKSVLSASTVDTRAQIPDAKAREDLSREFDFPINDSSGKEVTKIKYFVENAELHDQIVVSGQTATAIKGKTFLVINLKLENDYDKAIQMNTKDYVRLSRNGTTEMLAADTHSDPVTIQPISTKYTRLGFAINDNDKDLQLHVGEISGNKTTIDIHF